MNDQVPIYARVTVCRLLDEWWWEVREVSGKLFDFGYDEDMKRARITAREAAERLGILLGIN